jgi:hypothetical protein
MVIKTVHKVHQVHQNNFLLTAMETIIDNFIINNDLDEDIKDNLIELVNGCFTKYVGHMSKEWLTEKISNTVTTGSKAKKEKMEDPTEAETRDDLRKCTAITLNSFCKENGLKIGGNKSDIMDRVWRYIQGQNSDEDKGRASKPKKETAKKESHQCYACNSAGNPCGVAANEQYEDYWFCFRHIDHAPTFIIPKAEIKELKEEEERVKTEVKNMSKKPVNKKKGKSVDPPVEAPIETPEIEEDPESVHNSDSEPEPEPVVEKPKPKPKDKKSNGKGKKSAELEEDD